MNIKREIRKHMSAVPGGDVDLDPVEQDLIVNGTRVEYEAKSGNAIKWAWYVAFYIPREDDGPDRICVVYGFIDQKECYCYVQNNNNGN